MTEQEQLKAELRVELLKAISMRIKKGKFDAIFRRKHYICADCRTPVLQPMRGPTYDPNDGDLCMDCCGYHPRDVVHHARLEQHNKPFNLNNVEVGFFVPVEVPSVIVRKPRSRTDAVRL